MSATYSLPEIEAAHLGVRRLITLFQNSGILPRLPESIYEIVRDPRAIDLIFREIYNVIDVSVTEFYNMPYQSKEKILALLDSVEKSLHARLINAQILKGLE